MTFAVGDAVQTPFGKGVVREVRNNGQLLVQIQQRALLVATAQASPLGGAAARAASSRAHETRPRASSDEPHAPAPGGSRRAPTEIDLHGLTVDEALARIDDALDHALRAGAPELRFIHGRSGGKLRAALHRRLAAITAVRAMRLDPRNAGVTIVTF